jgi:glycine betaine transporter
LLSINIFTDATGAYLSSLVRESFAINPFGDQSFVGGWTVFYWAWWISWAPFVGTFIARISRGRTIRQFVSMVILAPSLFCMIWFSVFGSLGLNLDNAIIEEAIQTTETTLFIVLSHYPLSTILSMVVVVILLIFFVTSADSAIYVLSMFSSEGSLDPPNSKKIMWGLALAFLALVLLITGGLGALQTVSIVAALPFAFVMLFCCVSMLKALSKEKGV